MLFKIGFLPIGLVDLLDILLVAFIFYKIYQYIHGSMAARMVVGLMVIVAVSILADFLDMSGTSWIFNNLRTVWLIAFFIIFQPELRRMLVYLGQNPVLRRIVKMESPRVLEEVVSTVVDLSKKNFGALIVLVRDTGLRSIIETGIPIQAQASKPLLLSIFNPRSPLHDGAVIIQGDVILAAKCQLPLTQNPNLDPTLGMRHRAALGLSEQTDALILVVSEETGMISLAENGKLTRGLNEESLRKRLMDSLSPEAPKRKSLFEALSLSEEV